MTVARRLGALVAGVALTGACSASPTVPAARAPATGVEPAATVSAPSGSDAEPAATAAATAPSDVAPDQVVVAAGRPGRPLDRRLLGTNVPAWIGPDRLADPAFREATVASGTTLLRMPGGSWSNAYDWAGCEVGDDERCFWTWAARPSDFASFLRATGIEGSWTVSFNDTAQAAAAAVAFFNGEVGDDTAIGVDRDGVDWGTVGRWAELRAAGGNPDPVRIELWEVGNEIYGATQAAGGGCAPFGWEDVWTCDGTEYVEGDDDHDGYLAFRDAMLSVDPAITVGAVGVGDPSGWNRFGEKVIEGAGDDLDLYVVHEYGFDRSPSAERAIRRPATLWPDLLADVRAALGDDVPIAVTEYNLVSFEAGDTEATMTEAMSALFVADSIGRFAQAGVAIANQWNLANGVTSSGTDYGMIDLDDGTTRPQYDALVAWAGAGTELVAAASGDDDLAVYPTRDGDAWSIVVVNVGADDVERTIDVDGAELGTLRRTGVRAEALEDTSLVELEPVELSATPRADGGSTLALEVPAWSITVLTSTGGGSGA